MKPVFADALHFIALLSADDHWHLQAVALNREPPGPLVTTEWVLMEVGDGFSFPTGRPRFLRMLELLRQQPDVEIVPATSALFQRGVALYAQRPDKDWSLTDCTSFVVMQERGLTDALTHDHHFEQAGFSILLKD
ncbi:MAG: PIN domain-containing protein [Verrucomicrobia bacterium]|nr:PIN domain-containing protein [Verrucomicrobiota bacterium]